MLNHHPHLDDFSSWVQENLRDTHMSNNHLLLKLNTVAEGEKHYVYGHMYCK
jgi:hypothetical protein